MLSCSPPNKEAWIVLNLTVGQRLWKMYIADRVEEKFGAREEGSVPDANAETELEDKKRKFIYN